MDIKIRDEAGRIEWVALIEETRSAVVLAAKFDGKFKCSPGVRGMRHVEFGAVASDWSPSIIAIDGDDLGDYVIVSVDVCFEDGAIITFARTGPAEEFWDKLAYEREG